MKPLFSFLAFCIVSSFFLAPCSAEMPVVKEDAYFKVALSMKPYYKAGEPVTAAVRMENAAKRVLRVSRGLDEANYTYHLKIVDPRGFAVIPWIPGAGSAEIRSDPMPLAHLPSGEKTIQVTDCETLGAEFRRESRSDDLRKNYRISLPGYYAAQVQLDTMIFKDSMPCNVTDYLWQGLLKSEPRKFFYEGSTPVTFRPRQWDLSSLRKTTPGLVTVTILPEQGMMIAEYDADSVRLNNVAPLRAVADGEAIRADFSLEKVFKSFPQPVRAGKSYTAFVLGKLKSGVPFGGARQIKVTE